MEERVFVEYGDVKVTNALFINGGQTFAINNVTSSNHTKRSLAA